MVVESTAFGPRWGAVYSRRHAFPRASHPRARDRRGAGLSGRSVGAVPRSVRRRRGRRSRPPRDLERNRKRRVEDRHSRHRVELAGGLGRPGVRHRDHRRRRRTGADQGPVRSRRRERPYPLHGRAPLDDLRRRLPVRQDPLGARAGAFGAEGAAPHQEQLRVRNAGDRRRARLRLLRQHRHAGRARHERPPGLGAGAGRLRRTPGVRHRRVAGPPR